MRKSGWANLPDALFADGESWRAAQGEYATDAGDHPLGWLMRETDASRDRRKADPLANNGRWSIPLTTYTGDQRMNRAQQLMRIMGKVVSSRDLWVEDTQGKATVHIGRFDQPDSGDAQRTLRRIQEFEYEGQTPFADAALKPIGGRANMPIDPLDGRRYTGYFTLQVAYFTDDMVEDRRKAAEDLAREMRTKDVEAYLYHGRRMSQVTVGLFTREQAFVPIPHPVSPGAMIDAYSPLVEELQQRFPHNLPAGKKPENPDAKIVESSLVQFF